MKKSTAIVLVLGAATLLAGCEGARKALTQTKAAPDEFAVYTRAPLTMPPDYGLRPPAEGKSQEAVAASARDEAKRVLLGSPNAPTQTIQAATPGTSAILAMAGAQRAEPGIRDLVDRETSSFANEDQKFMEKLLYSDSPEGAASVVDPLNESKRIQGNQALGKPINEGETPIIDAKPDTGLTSLFNGWFK